MTTLPAWSGVLSLNFFEICRSFLHAEYRRIWFRGRIELQGDPDGYPAGGYPGRPNFSGSQQ
jgi:hypothetical protein